MINYACVPTISACGDYYLLVNKVFGPDAPSLFFSLIVRGHSGWAIPKGIIKRIIIIPGYPVNLIRSNSERHKSDYT